MKPRHVLSHTTSAIVLASSLATLPLHGEVERVGDVPQGMDLITVHNGLPPEDAVAGRATFPTAFLKGRERIVEEYNPEITFFYRLLRLTNPYEVPVSSDPEGGWGDPMDGLQLSIRLPQPEYLPAERVAAILTVRNVGTNSKSIWWHSNDMHDFDFHLTSESNSWVWSKPSKPHAFTEDPPMISPTDLPPQTQLVAVMDLSRFFGLTNPGAYSLQARLRERLVQMNAKRQQVAELETESTNLVSGRITFKIVENYSAEALATIRAREQHLEELRQRCEVVWRTHMSSEKTNSN